MSTPTKLCKRGWKPKIDSHNNNCRFCGASFTSNIAGVFENVFLPSGRQSAGLFLRSVERSIGPANRTLHFIEKAVPTKAD